MEARSTEELAGSNGAGFKVWRRGEPNEKDQDTDSACTTKDKDGGSRRGWRIPRDPFFARGEAFEPEIASEMGRAESEYMCRR